MNLPEPPGILSVEEEPDALRISWRTAGGEFRRRIRVAAWTAVAACMLSVLLALLVISRKNPPPLAVLPAILPLPLMLLVSVVHVLRLASGRIHAELRLVRDALSFSPGGGVPVVRVQRDGSRIVPRGDRILILSPPQSFWRQTLFSLFAATPTGVSVQPPSAAGEAWLSGILDHWHSGRLWEEAR